MIDHATGTGDEWRDIQPSPRCDVENPLRVFVIELVTLPLSDRRGIHELHRRASWADTGSRWPKARYQCQRT